MPSKNIYINDYACHMAEILLNQHGSPLLTLDQVAAILGTNRRTLLNRRSARTLPFTLTKCGKKLLCSTTDIANYLARCRVNADSIR